MWPSHAPSHAGPCVSDRGHNGKEEGSTCWRDFPPASPGWLACPTLAPPKLNPFNVRNTRGATKEGMTSTTNFPEPSALLDGACWGAKQEEKLTTSKCSRDPCFTSSLRPHMPREGPHSLHLVSAERKAQGAQAFAKSGPPPGSSGQEAPLSRPMTSTTLLQQNPHERRLQKESTWPASPGEQGSLLQWLATPRAPAALKGLQGSTCPLPRQGLCPGSRQGAENPACPSQRSSWVK